MGTRYPPQGCSAWRSRAAEEVGRCSTECETRRTAETGDFSDRLSGLISVATFIPCDQDVYNNALRRQKVGNPPGKQTGLGDEMNWEALLKKCPNRLRISTFQRSTKGISKRRVEKEKGGAAILSFRLDFFFSCNRHTHPICSRELQDNSDW